MQNENFRRSCWFCGETPVGKYTHVDGVEYKLLFYAGYDDLLHCHVNIIEVDGEPKIMLYHSVLFPKVIMTEEQLLALINDLAAGRKVVSPFVNNVQMQTMPAASGIIHDYSVLSWSEWPSTTSTFTSDGSWIISTSSTSTV